MFDFGDGTAACQLLPNPAQDCKSNLFGKECTALNGSLQINLRNTKNVENYSPTVQNFLNSIGLGSVSVISDIVTVFVFQDTPKPIPPLSPTQTDFLSSLESTNIVQVVECDAPGCNPNFPPPPPSGPVLKGLPGFRNIRKAGFLQVENTGFNDFTSLRGLVCPIGNLFARGNTNMTSFDGLQSVPLNPGGTKVNATGSGPFLTANSLTPLNGLSGCPSGTNTGAITIPVGCQTLTTSAEICNYKGSSPCR